MTRTVIRTWSVDNLQDLFIALREASYSVGDLDEQIRVSGPYDEPMFIDMVRYVDKDGKVTHAVTLEEADCIGRPRIEDRDPDIDY
jgi:hypothetical protein